MYQVIHKFFVKAAVAAVTIITLTGEMIPQYVSAESTQIYVQNTKNEKTMEQRNIGYSTTNHLEEAINQRLISLLGTLNEKVSKKERKKAHDILADIISLETVRREEKKYDPTEAETTYIKQLNQYLNKLTIKYFPEAKKVAEELQDAYKPAPPLKNSVIENIKSSVSKTDYKKIKKLYEEWVKNSKDIDKAGDDIYSILLKYKKLKADDVLMNIFTVNNGTAAKFTINNSKMTLTYQDPTGTGIKKISKKKIAEYKKAWKELRKILPDVLLKDFKEFDISTDGEFGILAFVQNIDDEGKTWKISIDPADMGDKKDFAATVIHEYGHYLSLNQKQVTYINENTEMDQVMEDFDLYREPSIVAKKDSYLNQFYNQFWKNIAIDRDADTNSQLFYFRHSDDFINTYTSTSCAEDFAECFAFYVLPPKNGLIEEQQKKLDFFQQFEEAKTAKKLILANMKKSKFFY